VTAVPAEEFGKDGFMATQTTAITARMVAAKAMPMARKIRRRSIDPDTGRALVTLGHALEYLADEFIREGGSFAANRGQVDAIQILIGLNRQIYMACPEVPTFRQWLGSFVHLWGNGSASGRKVSSGLNQGRV